MFKFIDPVLGVITAQEVIPPVAVSSKQRVTALVATLVTYAEEPKTDTP